MIKESIFFVNSAFRLYKNYRLDKNYEEHNKKHNQLVCA